MSATTQHFGAKWWKFDFHNHTAASDDYGAGPNQTALKVRSHREWLLDYMKAGIDCAAITDHNSGAAIDALKNELALLDFERPTGCRPLVLFPGVEISVSGGVHILAIFDPATNENKIVSVLSKCEFEGEHGKTNDCTMKSCAEVIEIIHSSGGIAVLAHADTDCGLFHAQSGVTLKQSLRADGLLAMELVDPAFVLPGSYKELRLNLTSIIGSDSHHPNNAGRRYTWVKMEKPSLAALRLALHDGTDGVKRIEVAAANPNEIGPRFYLRKLCVTRGQKIGNGQDFLLEFSPWLTTIIGGRGSGKSSILDFLRIVLARTQGMPPQVKAEFENFYRIPHNRGELGMLRAESIIRIELVKDARDIALICRAGGTWTQQEKNVGGEWTDSSEVGDIAKRFPLRIFSQKQLYEMTKQPDVLLNLIDERWDKRGWTEKRQTLTDRWLQNRRDARQAEKIISGVGRTRAELEDIKAKIRIFEDSGHKEILNNYQAALAAKQALDAKNKQLTEAEVLLTRAYTELPSIRMDANLKATIGEKSSNALESILGKYAAISSEFLSLQKEISAVGKEWRDASGNIVWNTTFTEALKKYEDLKTQLQQAGGADISSYSGLVEQRTMLEAKVSKLNEHELALLKLNEAKAAIVGELNAHERILRNERRQVIASWAQPASTEHIRVTLQPMGDKVSAEQQLRQLIRKSGEEFSNDIGRLLDELAQGVMDAERWSKIEEIRKVIREATYDEPKGLDRRFARHLETLRSSTPDDIDRISAWTPDDILRLELVKADGSVEDIESGSAGQRTAALLGLVLSLDDSPLIIDQPEDDLETRLISSLVVTGLRQLKQKQQVIVVTHNANIPVNGAAEQIAEMRFATGQIQVGAMGALQRQEIRQAVCDVMEGGKEALDKRYFRISRALS